MKKLFTALFVAGIGATALATTYTGTLTTTSMGTTSSQEFKVKLEAVNGNYTVTIPDLWIGNTALGTVVVDELTPSTTGDITMLYASRDITVQSGTSGTSWTGPSMGEQPVTMLARWNGDNMLVIDMTLASMNATLTFDNTADHFQLPNGDMEAWTASTGEPDRWHGFMSASGNYASTSQKYIKLEQSSDVHSGTSGNYSAVMTAKKILFTIGNGTMTNGQLIAGSMSAQSTDNHAEMSNTSTNTDANGDPFYMSLYAKPDSIAMWLKYTQGTANSSNKASVSAVAFDGSYYQEPYDSDYACVAGRAKDAAIEASDWLRHAIAFDYDSYASNNAEAAAIFVTFATNATPGQGSDGDQLFVDDIALVYNARVTDIQYKGSTISGFDPAVTTYTINSSETPTADNFTVAVQGVSAVTSTTVTKTATGYQVVIIVTSGDLKTATTYTINFTTHLAGDVNGDGKVGMDDVTALIDYLLNSESSTVTKENADVNGDGTVGMDDLTVLIDSLLNK